MNTHRLKISISLLIVLLVLIHSANSYCQSTNEFDKAAITQEARGQLTQMASEGGELNVFSLKNGIKGEFTCDITLQGKGNVLTVYMVSASSEDIMKKNLLKDKLHTLHFENIRIPKKDKIKIRQTFTF